MDSMGETAAITSTRIAKPCKKGLPGIIPSGMKTSFIFNPG